jgi:hypothetical protein
MRSKWLDSKPNSVGFVGSPSEGNPIIRPERARIIANSPEDEATKPTKPPLHAGEMPSSSEPTKPLRIRVVEWNLKEPPIAIEYHAVVTNPAKFASGTLGELRERLTNPKRKYGWSVPQLIDRLAQVGVTVALEIDKSSTEHGP